VGPLNWGSSPEGYEGTKCAFIECPKMYQSKSQAHPGELYVSTALIPADNDGYHARNACPARPNTVYSLSFRIKGGVPCARISVSGEDDRRDSGESLSLD